MRTLLPALCKLVLLAVFVGLTNFGFLERVTLLAENGRLVGGLLPYLAIWGLALAALMVAAFQPHALVRAFWALPIALSSAFAYGYYRLTQSDLSVYDILSLWGAKHEAGRAAEFYGSRMLPAFAVFAFGFAVIALPPAVRSHFMRRWLPRAAWLPLVPIAVIGAIVYAKGGGGSQAMPKQFAPLALGAVVAEKIATQGTHERRPVAWTPQAAPRQNIVMMIDESIRADFVDLTPGNLATPRLAELAPKFVNYGSAASGGNCSNYSNAILRFMASRRNLTETANTNPTIWQYAKKAGYRTVFIDAQAGVNKDPGFLQNFMSITETADIDARYNIDDVDTAHADYRLIDIVAEELKKPGPVFIYADKNGAHFPYDKAYPADQARFHPTISEAGAGNLTAFAASYRNAISWAVDRFMETLFAKVDFANATMIYTSDHGQALSPGVTHCVVSNPDPRMGYVPLMVHTGKPELRAKFAAGAELNRGGKASHFQIAPTVLSLMGYADADIAKEYNESLFTAAAQPPAFSSGDIFGLFAKDPNWTVADPSVIEIEPEAVASLPRGTVQ